METWNQRQELQLHAAQPAGGAVAVHYSALRDGRRRAARLLLADADSRPAAAPRGVYVHHPAGVVVRLHGELQWEVESRGLG